MLLGAALCAWIWRRQSAARRHAIWLAALLTLLALPGTKLLSPCWQWSSREPQRTAVFIAVPGVRETLAEHAVDRPERARLTDWRSGLLAIWLAGATLLVGYRLLGSVQLVRWRWRTWLVQDAHILALARDIAEEMNLTRTVQLRSGVGEVPLTWGIWKPVVLLPRSATGWGTAQIAAALRHEFGHIVRRDILTRALAQIACALYWPNPLVWLAAHRLHAAQEEACDDLVLRAGTPAADYATQLFEVAQIFTPSARQAVGMAWRSTLETRLRAIIESARDRRPLNLLTTASVVAVATLVLLGSALAQVSKETPAPARQAFPREQVEIAAQIIDLPSGGLADWKTGEYTPAQLAALLEKVIASGEGVDQLTAPRVITNFGQKAVIEIGDEKALAEGEGAIALEVLVTIKKDRIRLETMSRIVRSRSSGRRMDQIPGNFEITPGNSAVTISQTNYGPSRDRLIIYTVRLAPVAKEEPAAPKPVAPPPAPPPFGLQPMPAEKLPGVAPQARPSLPLLGLQAIPSTASQRMKDKFGEVPIEIRAAEMRMDNKMMHANGDAELIYRDVILKADKLRYDSATRIVEADGNVMLVQDGGKILCKRLTLELMTRKVKTEGRARISVPQDTPAPTLSR